MDYDQSYRNYREIIDEHLKRLITESEPAGLYEPIKYILFAGGKRIRPTLLLLACESLGGNYKGALNAAVAVEIFHNFTLVHDDIMDNADLRRGIQTIHKKWDMNTAILSGDAMFAIAYKLLSQTKSNRLSEIFTAFSQSAIEVCEGQALDLELETKFDVTVDDYIKMINKKTASLIKNSVKIGGLIADGSEEQILALENYGLNLGLAFQFQDDLLDVIADEEFGKSIGGDIVNGKRTFLLLRAKELTKDKDREIIMRVFNKDGIDASLVPIVKEIYYRCGVIEETQNKVKFYTELAVKSIEDLPKSRARDMLIWLANKLCERKI
ncbi:polyprenyl synthetase family protein [Candidatus Chrysopegis kryptomonas]|uniref:Farnesyl-diphosphate synthase /geranylgeranyl-diphosphate synthase n=1 Tax=Candidatus Chryseopegocella kryptomonas TaxID=1633643 RepID=A0A0P1NVG0_9BACT|nr:polyprenyl synthetase family protein [Candidatus Chrysopegis kryptomonas]CUT03205.1 farnesyl-diphosphate synthase /geranylgeranyl-diphosphate synthase [Candidatus Chrysopegis kryptomonas]